MVEKGDNFVKSKIFDYNLRNKRMFVFWAFFVAFILIIFTLYYFIGLRDSDFIVVQWINGFVNHIGGEIKSLTMLGAFYTTLFGGLFFLPLPMEALFIPFLTRLNPIVLIATFMLGILISYEINYVIGMRLSEISKKIIGYKQFYKLKGYTNKYGMGTIFIFNLLPLPSQPLSAILGVFRYNRTKNLIAYLSGELLKFVIMAVAYLYFFK